MYALCNIRARTYIMLKNFPRCTENCYIRLLCTMCYTTFTDNVMVYIKMFQNKYVIILSKIRILLQ